MVFYFTSGPGEKAPKGYLLYMGRDKHENEELIKYAWPEDVWFHVDKESSAHVYIRLPRGIHETGPTWYKEIPENVVEECCQLVKANSIKGNKMDNVSVVFTPASNLKKTQGMDTGQVGFHNQNLVFKAKIETRKNEIVNRLEKTKRWEEPDLQADLMQRRPRRPAQPFEGLTRAMLAPRQKEDKAERAKAALEEKQAREKQEAEWKAEKDARSYDKLYDETKMTKAGEMDLDSDGEPDFM